MVMQGERPHRVHNLFEAARLFFRHASPALLGAQVLVAGCLRCFAGGPDRVDAFIALGIALYWPIQEYLLHRAVLHMKPWTLLGKRVDPLSARYHRHHHRHPWNLDYTFLPARMIVGMIPVHVGLWWWATDQLSHALTGIILFGGAALSYEWIHYLTHTAYRPRTRWMRTVSQRHRWHHFKHERFWFAFIVPRVDAAFGTDPDPATVERSATCRTLLSQAERTETDEI